MNRAGFGGYRGCGRIPRRDVPPGHSTTLLQARGCHLFPAGNVAAAAAPAPLRSHGNIDPKNDGATVSSRFRGRRGGVEVTTGVDETWKPLRARARARVSSASKTTSNILCRPTTTCISLTRWSHQLPGIHTTFFFSFFFSYCSLSFFLSFIIEPSNATTR